ncbi:ABC transporter ATP-binding protein [Chryseobacterium sp. SNU WT5]|uniref:ABC transporter ATP-binding protein n=1 Tax=Chryseobacterium sp. SNU WT5 TaxID=2594269 RepID=UPI00117DB01F|nr:ABC transporter ATP-binding protein [Chryseobacterium sp. SNU WT5]QDP84146.1 ABC transporter ATP-binding protein [Chryseobacterium sp. SNU WT5]
MFLELKNTSIGYNTPLISGVDTSLKLGEICLLVGNNGVGKTTLIKSILKQNPVLEGEILLNGEKVDELSNEQIARNIAIVFSKSVIPVNYTLRDLISLGKYIHYPYYFELSQEDQQEVEDIINDLNLMQYRDFQLTQLSDGNLQKAFIGRALAQNSPMIILDEPTTHLDEENKITILTLLRKLAKSHHKVILFSSHDWRLAKEFADKMWFIHNKSIDAGITEEVLLRNNELLNPQLFQFTDQFIAPEIFAPELHKEMLYSFLQKNFQKNLSDLKFEFKETFWVISKEHIQHKCDSFEEMAQYIQNLH